MLSILGLAGDTRTSGLMAASGLSGIIPEIGEEVVGAMASDTVHELFPELADPGNLEYLKNNMGSTALGLAIGIFGMSGGAHALAGSISHVDALQVYRRSSPEIRKLFKDAVTGADKQNFVAVARTIKYLEAIASGGLSGEGSAAVG